MIICTVKVSASKEISEIKPFAYKYEYKIKSRYEDSFDNIIHRIKHFVNKMSKSFRKTNPLQLPDEE